MSPPIVIVAGGPSLRGFDFDRLRGYPVIAINRAYEVIPHASALWWTDGSFAKPRLRELLAHPAPLKASVYDKWYRIEYPPEVTVYEFTGMCGLDRRPGKLRHGNNSGHAALNLAWHLREPGQGIILLGYDMRFGPQGESHFHSGYWHPARERTLTEKMLPFFGEIAREMVDVPIFNASPESALTHWPKGDFDAAERYFHGARDQGELGHSRGPDGERPPGGVGGPPRRQDGQAAP